MNLPLLPSCWGFSFALGRGVSPHSHSSAYHLTGVSLILDVGDLLSVTGRSSTTIVIAGRNSNNLRYADDITLRAQTKEELKSLLKKVKEESGKVGLKLNIQKTKIMASSPITSWQIDGETVETVADFIFRGSKITADGDCSHEIKRCLLLGRKVMTNLDSIFKAETLLCQQRFD